MPSVAGHPPPYFPLDPWDGSNSGGHESIETGMPHTHTAHAAPQSAPLHVPALYSSPSGNEPCPNGVFCFSWWTGQPFIEDNTQRGSLPRALTANTTHHWILFPGSQNLQCYTLIYRDNKNSIIDLSYCSIAHRGLGLLKACNVNYLSSIILESRLSVYYF